MIIIHNPDHQQHDGRYEMFRGRLVPCHESPQRLEYVLKELAKRPLGEMRLPGPMDHALLRRIHDPLYLDFLAGAWEEWIAMAPGNAELDVLPSIWPVRGFRHDAPSSNFTARLGRFSFDSGTPLTQGTWPAALAGAACAVEAARAVSGSGNTKVAMALTRPPGHHAGSDFFGGYCFLNNAALAAQALRDAGADRVAILDIDYHHGNGTQTIFYDRSDVMTVSIHGDPTTEYPFYLGYADEIGVGAGEGYNLNIPLAAGTDYSTWNTALQKGLSAIRGYGANALVVSLGVDTFEGDPISKFKLSSDDFLNVGKSIASARLPTVFVMEGGYAVDDLGKNVVNVLAGFES